jgi:Mg-chelatase subunit ChlD
MESAVRTIRFVPLLLACLALACQQRSSSTAYEGRNPLDEMLKSPQQVTRQEGIAAAILVDTSGSMEDHVTGSDGLSMRKIDVARRAVVDLIRQFEQYAAKDADRPVRVGVYEFSSRDRQPHCRNVIELGPPNLAAAESAVDQMTPQGGTPIGDAMIKAKRDLDLTGISRRHILVVTDGKNNKGYSPGAVADAIARQPREDRTSVYFVAFDVSAERFNAVKEAGGLVLEAANERELNQTMDFILTGKILVEQPTTPAAR